MSKLSRAIGAAKLALHAKSPTLLVVGGVIAMGSAAVMACRTTYKLETALEPIQDRLEALTKLEDSSEAKTVLVIEVAKVYAPAFGVFCLGAGMTFKGHTIMRQRNAALAMAFTTLKKTLDNYRARVIAEQGHEVDQRYMNSSKEGIRTQNGYAVKVDARDWDESAKDPYNRVFSNDTSSQWQNDLGANKHFIAQQQRFAQQRLNHKGHLYLSDVYECLGIAESDVSRVCGWRITTLADGTRNVPIVDFGIDIPMAEDWKYNQHKAVFLQFNCQGLILGGKIQKAIEAAAM